MFRDLNENASASGGPEPDRPRVENGGDATGSGAGSLGIPSISLPKGGGAIRGLGEKFAANPVTGTGSLTLPIFTSPGRSGFGPQLTLSYDSAAGNGPFGLGWQLSLPAITRKTDKGLPRYRDHDESDVFILSGTEDLVPTLSLDAANKWVPEVVEPRTVNNTIYDIKRYRPRIEGLFARIERWTSRANPLDVCWRSISRENITTWYGKTEESRIADPAHPENIFNWLICESYDDKGNVVSYEYKAENDDDVALSSAHERNRSLKTRQANRYLKHIRYGNHAPYLPKLNPNESWPKPENDKWYFEVVFDYGEHDAATPIPRTGEAKWKARPDPFSSYRASFEVRTYRLCQRALMFHHFKSEANVGLDCLVKSTDFTYSYEETPTNPLNPIHSVLLSASQSGYKRQGSGYSKKSLPALEFEYTEATIDETVRELDHDSVENIPYGVDGANYQFVDLDGEGLSGILTEQANAWFYKRNLSPLSINQGDASKHAEARFGPLEVVTEKPSLAVLGGKNQQLIDLSGDGQLDLVLLSGPAPGFYERTQDENWVAHRSFSSLPNVEWENPNLKFIDLTGDGHADLLITEDEVFSWYPSLAEEGFAKAEQAQQSWDEEKGPKLLLVDGKQAIFLADMTGDGLIDLVRIRNGEICYWPNLGYGRFGAKVSMDNAPGFEEPEVFDDRRVRLADIDGSGTNDILYLGRDGIHVYFNQSGNSWSEATKLSHIPHADSLNSITITDLLGNGTACLVWSSSSPADARHPMSYIDLMGGQKPHLLVKSRNNLGAETRVQYSPSTKFYLQDKANGKPWITRLPFPVHVVERVEVFDAVSRNRFVTRYAYHHGYFDGFEREFRGFGQVEQWDTEEFAALSASEVLSAGSNILAESHVPPVMTRTWFHTGSFEGDDRISKQFEREYYREGDASAATPGITDLQARTFLLDDTVFPSTTRRSDGTRVPYKLTSEEISDACRSLKGSILRQEVYAFDGTDESDRPYITSERNYTIEIVQPGGANKAAIFFTHPREQLDFHYERKLVEIDGQQHADPRLSHEITLEVDDCGNVLRSIKVGYRRRALPGVDAEEQKQTHLTLTTNRFINKIRERDWYRVGVPVETRTYEIVKPPEPVITARRIEPFKFAQLEKAAADLFPLDQIEPATANIWPYEKWDWRTNPANAPAQARLRLIEHFVTRYRKDDLSGLSAVGDVESHALPGENYKLALTPGLLDLYAAKIPIADLKSILQNEGKYVDLNNDGHWWIPSGRVFYSRDEADLPAKELDEAIAHYFLPRRYTDPFGNALKVDYDKPADLVSRSYDLLLAQTEDALKNITRAVNDYRVLQAQRITDANGNQNEAAFDILGLVVATATVGKNGEGDKLEGFVTDPSQVELDTFVGSPRPPNRSLLGSASTRILYDVDRFARTGKPAYAAVLERETHASEPGGAASAIRVSFDYSDGFGRSVQKKIQAEVGPLLPGGVDVNPRWVGSGWTIFNNKSHPVRQFEPFFSASHEFEFGRKMGVSPVLFYDPIGRVVATLHPNHTYEKTVFDPWQQSSFDTNDLVTSDPRTDDDVKGFFLNPDGSNRLAADEYLPTWHSLRTDPANAVAASERWPEAQIRAAEKAAAIKAAAHKDTPTTTHIDSLGRAFLTVTHNRFERTKPDGTVETVEEKYPTRIFLDISGNKREVRDPVAQNGDSLGRVVVRYDYDMMGQPLKQVCMETGSRWLLSTVGGQPIRSWDDRGFSRRLTYDALQRCTGLFVTEPTGERLARQTIYGEDKPSPELTNHRGRIWQARDDAGNTISEAYDFKGNLLKSKRDLRDDYEHPVNWAGLVFPASSEALTATSKFDALGRVTEAVAPDGSVTRPHFNEANLLDSVDVQLAGAAASRSPVANINYNAKGQRKLIVYDNGVQTSYQYDAQSFRLTRVTTTRSANPDGMASELFKTVNVIQDLRYSYDAVGNITRIEDAALKTIVNNGEEVVPVCDYVYDAVYRLVEAKGREHIGQTAHDFNPPENNRRDYFFLGRRSQPTDAQALRNYTEHYEYDAAGNFTLVRHVANGGAWTRTYSYNESSLIEPAKQSNRLTKTTVGNGDSFTEIYGYKDSLGHDVSGCMTSVNSMKMRWDFEERLTEVDLQGGGTAHYVYDAGGQRARKVIDRNGATVEERIYFGSYEVFRKKQGAVLKLERQTLHVMDDKRRVALIETRTADIDHNDPGLPQLFRYQVGNHLGSTTLELDQQAQLISYEEYTPYGATSFQAVRSQTETSKRYRYTGTERDEETGFCYHGARYYAPWLGKWISCDPGGYADGLNLYRYVSDNPTMLVDDTGLAGAITDETKITVVRGGKSEVIKDEKKTTYAEVKVEGRTPDQIAGDIKLKTGVRPYDLARSLGEEHPGPDSWGKLEAALEDEGLIEPVAGPDPSVAPPVPYDGPAAGDALSSDYPMLNGVLMSPFTADLMEGLQEKGNAQAVWYGVGGSFAAAAAARGQMEAIKDAQAKSDPQVNSAPAAPANKSQGSQAAPAAPPTGQAPPPPPPPATPAPPDQVPDVFIGALRRWRVTPSPGSRGVSPEMRREAADWARRYGTVDGPPTTGSVHVGHQFGGSHVFTPNGQQTTAGAQTARGNLSQASAEARAAAMRRQYNEANPNSPQLSVRAKGSR